MLYIYSKKPEEVKSLGQLAAAVIRSNLVAVLPTDTIYGLSCRADSARAVARIFALKGRNPGKSLIVLVDSVKMLKNYVFLSAQQEKLLQRIWFHSSRPTTVILKHRGNLPRELSGRGDSLALRLPKNPFLIKILRTLKCPIVSTSLNLSGQPNIVDLRELPLSFPDSKKQPDLIVDAGPCRRHRPSRLLDLRDPNHLLTLRK